VKFVFEYRTSDNVRHEGVINAASRDAAFMALREKGIRPSRMAEAPGLLNKFLGKGKRWLAIGVLVGVVAILFFKLIVNEKQNKVELSSAFDVTDRHQIYGDAAIITAGVKTDWQSVLPRSGDRLLSKFIQPGVRVSRVFLQNGASDDLFSVMDEDLKISDDDLLEHRQVKAIVNGLRREMNEYLRDGGSVYTFLERLTERQEVEAAIYRRLEKEVQEAKGSKDLYSIWAKKNEELRSLGIRTIPLPDELLYEND